MNSKEALEILVSKTNLLNNTCSSLNNCIKSKKCVLNTPCENCDDYNLVMTIKQDLYLLEQLKKDLKTTYEFNKKLREENSKYKKTINKINKLPDCDICDANWNKGCMCLKKKIKEVIENETNN